MHKPFLIQYSRNIFLKHSVIDNFHIKTIDLPFYRSETEARSRHLTFCVTSLHGRRPVLAAL